MNLSRTLASLGGLLSLIGFANFLVQSLISTINIKISRLKILFNLLMLHIFVVILAIIAGFVENFVSITSLGILMEVIAVIIIVLQTS